MCSANNESSKHLNFLHNIHFISYERTTTSLCRVPRTAMHYGFTTLMGVSGFYCARPTMNHQPFFTSYIINMLFHGRSSTPLFRVPSTTLLYGFTALMCRVGELLTINPSSLAHNTHVISYGRPSTFLCWVSRTALHLGFTTLMGPVGVLLFISLSSLALK